MTIEVLFFSLNHPPRHPPTISVRKHSPVVIILCFPNSHPLSPNFSPYPDPIARCSVANGCCDEVLPKIVSFPRIATGSFNPAIFVATRIRLQYRVPIARKNRFNFSKLTPHHTKATMAHIPSDRATETPDEDTEKNSSNTTGFPPMESYSTTFPSEGEAEQKVANDLSSDGEVEDTMASSIASITAQANNATEDPVTNTADEPTPVPPHHATTPSPSDTAHLIFLRQHHPEVLTRTKSISHEKPPVFRHDCEFEHSAVLGLYPANSPEPSYDGVRYRAGAAFNYDAYRRGELSELESFIKPAVLDAIARFDLTFHHETL